MGERLWREIDSDEDFAALFVGAVIESASAVNPSDLPYIDADVFWRLTSGRVIAMYVDLGGGCPTCGYDNGTKTYWTIDPAAIPSEGERP